MSDPLYLEPVSYQSGFEDGQAVALASSTPDAALDERIDLWRQALALADSMLHSGESPRGHADGVIHGALNEMRDHLTARGQQ